jgi:cytochrome c oxidase subunit 3
LSLIAAWTGVAAGLLIWWMFVRRLATKPWEVQAGVAGIEPGEVFRAESARVGLWVFLGVATALFGLFITAYLIRRAPHIGAGVTLQDWRPVDDPRVLWINSSLLVAGSAAMQWARTSMAHGRVAQARQGLWLGGAFAIAFLLGQSLAWQQLRDAGYYAASNPANAFFYVLTAVHALHVIGGLIVWSRATYRLRPGAVVLGRTQLTVELCTVYWHFLLAVWLVLFALLLAT